MKTIKSKPKTKHTAHDIFFCKKCGGTVEGVTFDIDRNKYFCNIHNDEEAIKFSSNDFAGDNAWRMLFLIALMYPDFLRFDNTAYICPQCGEIHPSCVDAECEVGNEICKRCGSHVKTVNKEDSY